MKNISFLKHQGLWLVISFVMAVVFFGTHHYFNDLEKKSALSGFSKQNFEKTLHHNQKNIQSQLSLIAQSAANNPRRCPVASLDCVGSDYSFYVFCNDSLTSWNNALIPINQLNHKSLAQQVCHFPNGWYVIHTHKLDSITIYGTFRFKRDYVFENEYLFDSFHPSFHLSSVPGVTTTRGETLVNINDQAGQYLFSLRFNDQKPFYSWHSMINGSAFFLFVLALIALTRSVRKIYIAPISQGYGLLIGLLFLAIIYFASLSIRFSPALLSSKLFSPAIFALAWWLPSLGFFIVLSGFVFTWSLWFYRTAARWKQLTLPIAQSVEAKLFVSLMVSAFFFALLVVSLYILVENANDLTFFIELINISPVTIGKLLVLAFMLFSFLMVSHRMMSMVYPVIKSVIFLRSVLVFVLAFILMSIVTQEPVYGIVAFVFGSFQIAGFYLNRRTPGFIGYGAMVVVLFIFSFFMVWGISHFTRIKEMKNRSILIQNLSFKLTREDDPIAEMFLERMEKGIRNDQFLRQSLTSSVMNHAEITEHIRKNYFEGYFSRYDLQVISCRESSDLHVAGVSNPYNCYAYFANLLSSWGVKLNPSSSFYFLNNGDGRSSYFGEFAYSDSLNSAGAKLFIEINSKPYFVGVGYPELLTNKRDRINIEQYAGYSYAKYVNDDLVSRFGDYNYHLNSLWMSVDTNDNFLFFEQDGYSHLAYQSGTSQKVVLSMPMMTVKQLMVNFSFIFVVLLLFTTILLFIVKPYPIDVFKSASIQLRIQFAFVGLLIFLLIAMCAVTIYYSINQFKNQNHKLMTQKLNSVMVDLQHTIGHDESLGTNDTEFLNLLLQRSANVFFSDINFYSTDGKMLGSSRAELYANGIVSQLINHQAYQALAVRHESDFVTQECIGSLSFQSGYIPFYNYDNKLLGYLNVPYFVGAQTLHQQVSSIVAAIINSYLFFIFLAVGIAVILSRRIAFPLIAIRENIKNVQFGKSNVKIPYRGVDEIGMLVTEYNRMLDELSFSAEKLALSEREMAWREMAKQVAHEINNPLTPMKLSVQYLQRAWDERRDDYEKYMNRVTRTLIEQIDQLSYIASEFSSLAKMPRMHPENVNVIDKLKSAIVLFDKEENIRFEFKSNGHREAFVWADAEQLVSVFNNLIKNAIQSIEPDGIGVIQIAVSTSADVLNVSIADNGQGIPEEIREKLFKPNFTTKSTGMGLGLAIVKNIIVGLRGNIRFETELGVGTTFFISIPLKNGEKPL